VIPRKKLLYVLDPEHPAGCHKARFFKSALGVDASCPERLEALLREGIATYPALRRSPDEEGIDRWVVQWPLRARLGSVLLVSAWYRRPDDLVPRLASCYLKKVKR
jgi:hypothetical protein